MSTRERAESTSPTEAVRPRRIASWRDWVSLTKPRVVLLLLLTTVVAMALAAEGVPSLARLGLTLLGGYLCAGGAGAVNCYLDWDLDAQMTRTRDRAIPAGRVEPLHALLFGLLLTLASGPILWFGVHPAAAVLALLGFGAYVGVYTWWLKRRSSWNVVIGGLAGAAPPLVGWAAATGGTLSPTPFLLAAIVLFWTPAHFWALALMQREAYAAAGVPVLPVVRGERATRQAILVYAALTVALSAIPVVGGMMGTVYAVTAGALGGLLLVLALRMVRRAERTTDRQFYFLNLLYLAALFLAMLVDRATGW